MQETRKQILEILKERGEATVDDIVSDLTLRRGSITAVTVRHHLAKLQDDMLIDSSQIKLRTTPGRPQYIYALTMQGLSHLPNNYQHLASNLIKQINQKLSDSEVNVIIEGMVDSMVDEAQIGQGTMPERLNAVITYMNDTWLSITVGSARWRLYLHASNCPYHDIAQENDMLCKMDMRLIAKILGVVPRMISHVSSGGETCSYFIPHNN
ncbi:MAG: ArsR family transcriptional regulator [Anaerolineae bacterium]|nr:ArsR family transcriptional regulator [Anaerolineae bacterium]